MSLQTQEGHFYSGHFVPPSHSVKNGGTFRLRWRMYILVKGTQLPFRPSGKLKNGGHHYQSRGILGTMLLSQNVPPNSRGAFLLWSFCPSKPFCKNGGTFRFRWRMDILVKGTQLPLRPSDKLKNGGHHYQSRGILGTMLLSITMSWISLTFRH